MKIKIKELKQELLNILTKNMSKEDSEVVADYLIWAEMSGNKTQGIIKMAGTEPIQKIIPNYPIKIERETKISAVIDGGKNPAIVVAETAIEIAEMKAKEIGMTIVGARNTFSSNGAQAYYVEKLAKQGLIGIMMSRSPGSVAPFNSIDPLLGTNPIGFAFPTNDEPIVFDGATAAMTFYGLVAAKAHGKKIPEGTAIDEKGEWTTDPAAVIEGGAIVPFGNSYKAAGLGMLVELLAGPLIGGAYLDYKTFDKEWGMTIIAIDPSILTEVNEFKKNCSDFVSIIRNSRTRGDEVVRLPNEEAKIKYRECELSGEVEIDEVIYGEVVGEG